MLGAQKIDAGRADVAHDQGDGMLLWHSPHGAQAQRQLQLGAWILTLLGVHAHSMSRHANKLPGQGTSQQGNHAQRGSSLRQGQFRYSTRLRRRISRLRGGMAWPGFGWECAFRRAHFAPQRRNFYRCWLWPDKLLLFSNFGFSPSRPSVWGG